MSFSSYSTKATYCFAQSIATLPEIREDLSAGWMASSEAEGSGTPLLDPDSCRDRICRDPTPGGCASKFNFKCFWIPTRKSKPGFLPGQNLPGSHTCGFASKFNFKCFWFPTRKSKPGFLPGQNLPGSHTCGYASKFNFKCFWITTRKSKPGLLPGQNLPGSHTRIVRYRYSSVHGSCLTYIITLARLLSDSNLHLSYAWCLPLTPMTMIHVLLACAWLRLTYLFMTPGLS